jgi:hypothetical protein
MEQVLLTTLDGQAQGLRVLQRRIALGVVQLTRAGGVPLAGTVDGGHAIQEAPRSPARSGECGRTDRTRSRPW